MTLACVEYWVIICIPYSSLVHWLSRGYWGACIWSCAAHFLLRCVVTTSSIQPLAAFRRYGTLLSPSQVAWVVITASWGLKQLLFVRAEGPEDENSWSFGQVAAVVLFISPLCLVFEQFFNPGTFSVWRPLFLNSPRPLGLVDILTNHPCQEPADAADARRSGATNTRSDDFLEIQASEPEGLDARQEPIEWVRLVHITACWDAPSSRTTVHLFVGFNFLLMVYAFNDYVVFRAFIKMMTWFFVYQPI